MSKQIGIGHQNFMMLREQNNFYIDKTRFISEWWNSGDMVTLITRPRRFGKTLNMSMMEQFFSCRYAKETKAFEGLEIWKDERFRAMHGTYPVISLSFASVKGTNYKDTRLQINYLLTELYNDNHFLLETNLLTAEEKKFFTDVSIEMNDTMAVRAIYTMSNFLSRYYGKKVIILLDEYDTPMQEAFVNGFWNELLMYIRNLFNSSFKTNPYLERALLTGITRISKESIFSDLNNMEIISTTSDKYADCFGFTEKEVFNALDEFGLSEKKSLVKSWYDGFTFGQITDIYNPWSIINYLGKKKLLPYWANTSSNRLVSQLLWNGGTELKKHFEDLLKGYTFTVSLDEQIVFSQLWEKESAVWSLLLASGYLKIVSYEINEETGQEIYQLAITNREVTLMFQNLIRDWFAIRESEYHAFLKALVRDDIKVMNSYINQIAKTVFSFYDSGSHPSERNEPERFYHGFVLGLIVDLTDQYHITSNRESGFGRYDVMLEPKVKGIPAIIMEFKVFDPEEENDLQDTVKRALDQIEEKEYAAELIAKGISENSIHKYGFAFKGKMVLIGK